MMTFLRQALRRDDGFTLVEVSVALVVSAMVSATIVSVLMAMSQNAGDQARSADVQRHLRSVTAELVVELRQAERVRANDDPVAEIGPGVLEIFTDRGETEGPELVRYQRTSCSGGLCELWVTRYPAIAGTGPDWTFSSTALESTLLVENLLDDEPTFAGAQWSGDPITKVAVTACDASAGDECGFPIVTFTLRASTERTSAGGARTVEIREEVRIRNA